MPLFTFECAECNAASEVLVRNGESPQCPACGSSRLAKGLSHFAPVAAASATPGDCNLGAMCCGGGCGFSPN